MADVALKRGLPANTDAEQFCLGSVLRNNSALDGISGILSETDFALTSHRHIFESMLALRKSGAVIDRMTVANHLINQGKLERSGGLASIIALDESLPDIVNPEAYAQIVKEQAVLRKLALLGSRVAIEAINPGATPGDLMAGLETSLRGISSELSESHGQSGRSVAQIVEEIGINNLLSPSPEKSGLQTGFFGLDDRITGLGKQTLTIIAARPSVGKSALMSNIAVHIAAKQRSPTAIFSMEMSERSLVERMACSRAKINLLKLRSGILSSEERRALLEAVNYISALPLYIDDSSGLTHQQISGRLDRLRQKHGVKIAFIDYIQQMSYQSSKGRDRNENERLTEIAEAMKSTAKRQDVAIVALSQLSRAPEMRGKDHKPMLSDLRSSGGLEQAADLVVFIYRGFLYYPDKSELKDKAELIIGKQRNGPTGSVELAWRSSYATFENL